MLGCSRILKHADMKSGHLTLLVLVLAFMVSCAAPMPTPTPTLILTPMPTLAPIPTPTLTPTPATTRTSIPTPTPTLTPTLTPTPRPTATATPRPTATPIPTPTPAPTRPPLVGPPPSTRVAAFYYPWYGNPAVNGRWRHWQENQQVRFSPPKDISSNYYPSIGPYSSSDSSVIAQHMAWLRQAGVGLIIVSWQGRDSPNAVPIPKILDEAHRYGLKVIFQIESYQGRSASTLANDVSYLYNQYGTHPAFFWTTETSIYSQDPKPKGVFFLWFAGCEFLDCSSPDGTCKGNTAVPFGYWLNALEQIHTLPQGGIVLAQPQNPRWVVESHFDGLFNYATAADAISSQHFEWSCSLPPGTWYVPSILPGFVDHRGHPPPALNLARNDGATYDAQWQAALGTGIKPRLITITSWNEWHEGTQIEPAAEGVDNGAGFTYADYGLLGAEGYLKLTRQWVTRFEAMTWPTFGTERKMVSATLGITNTEDGLRQLLRAGDGPTKEASLSGRPCRLMVSSGVPMRYMYFNVQNDFIYAQATRVVVTVDYFDAGTGWLALQYDSSDFTAEPLEGRFKMTEQVRLRNSGTWQTATFQLSDAYFGDRQHNGVSDFRVASDQDLAISRVTVSR